MKNKFFLFLAIMLTIVIMICNYSFIFANVDVNNDLSIMQKDINDNNYSFTVGETSASNINLSDLTGLNFFETYQIYDIINKAEVKIEEDELDYRLPKIYDWRVFDGVTSVKNQGSAGTCWAFATTGVFEHAVAIKDKVFVEFSPQFLMAINRSGYGVNGGWFAHEYHQEYGAVLEEHFPYQGRDGIKFDVANYEFVYKLKDWGYVDYFNSIPSVNKLKKAIYEHGSLAVAVYADVYFQYYTGGIFDRNRRGRVNHAVMLIGWDDTKSAWILKNSWGEEWGENGYMYIKYGVNQIGYAATYAVYEGLD